MLNTSQSINKDISVIYCHFCIKSMFSSSLPPVVCKKVHILFTIFVFVCP